jgi:hypothetical protein
VAGDPMGEHAMAATAGALSRATVRQFFHLAQ